MMSIKVLIFSRDAAWFGGVVNFIELLKVHLSTDIAVQQFLIGHRKGASASIRPLVPLSDAIRLLWKVTTEQQDVYHLNPSLNGPSIFRDSLFLIVLHLFCKGRIVISFHGWESSVEQIIDKSIFIRWIFSKLLGQADIILVLAKPFKDWLIKIGIDADKVELYTTMFDGRVIQKRIVVSDVREVRLLFLSRLVNEKGVFELLQAFDILQKSYSNVTLKIAGVGPAESAMKSWVEKHNLGHKVEFVGYVRGEDKAAVLNSADVFVFPTYYGEGCPVSLLEAMAAGMAIVTTPVGGIPDIIADGKNGILITDAVSDKSVVSALEELLSDKQKISDMSRLNQEEAWQKYDAPIVTRFIEDIYRGGVGIAVD